METPVARDARAGTVSNALTALEEAVDRLGGVLAEHVERLSPVLAPSVPTDALLAKMSLHGDDGSAPIAAHLMVLVNRVHEHVNRITACDELLRL